MSIYHDPDSSHSSRKLFIQMSGAPGSGKSTMAHLLAPIIDAVIFDHDTTKSTVLENGIQFEQAARLTYNLGWTFAKDMIRQGRSVIIDSTCNFEETLVHGTTLAQEHSYEYWYVECKVDNIDLLDQRLRARNPLRSQRRGVECPPLDASSNAGSGNARSLFERWIEKPFRPETNAIIVDSTGSPLTHRDFILEQIRSADRVLMKDRYLDGPV